MKRQLWAACIGVLFGGAAVAQPSLETERYPLAPAMPGVVVSQPQGRPTATVTAITLKPVAYQTPGAIPAPVISASTAPYTNVATAQVLPVNGTGNSVIASAMPGCGMTGGCSTPASGGCSTGNCGGSGKLSQWLSFQSTSVQTGHYAMYYTPPLHAWFPCKPQAGGCSTCAAPAPACATGNCGSPAIQPGYAGPVTAAPAMPMTAPQVIVPTAAMNMAAGPMMRPVYTAEMVPVGAVGKPGVAPQADPLANFRKLNGMTFTPGGSPMAAPVSQAK